MLIFIQLQIVDENTLVNNRPTDWTFSNCLYLASDTQHESLLDVWCSEKSAYFQVKIWHNRMRWILPQMNDNTWHITRCLYVTECETKVKSKGVNSVNTVPNLTSAVSSQSSSTKSTFFIKAFTSAEQYWGKKSSVFSVSDLCWPFSL